MRVVVTGVAGFIGSHLAERLVADGCKVVGIDAFTPYYSPADKAANLGRLTAEPNFELIRGDVVGMQTTLARLFADRPAVVHLAAQPGVRASFGDGFDRYVHDNVLATQRVLESALLAGVRRVVYASSSSVYGDAEVYPCPETADTQPRSPYGVTKRTCEHLADVYRRLGLEAVGMRYFTVYGPRQRPDMAIRRICEAAFGGDTFRLHGDGQQSRDFTYVDDAVDATVRSITAAAPGPVLNVGGGREATMAEVIRRITDAAGGTIPITLSDVEPGDVRRTGADTRQARTQLGWSPAVSLSAGLEAELSWVRTRRASVETAPALAVAS
jgi:nucleoside-diphosphate-sugar epimerase